MGALYGGRIIPFGRKKVFILFNVFAIVGCLLTVLNVWAITFGKLLHGFFVTVVHIASIKMINETIPVYMLGSCGTVIQTSTALGYMLVLGFGLGLPSNDYNPALVDDELNNLALEANKADQFWRLIYAFPVVVSGWMLLSFLLGINEDSIMFNLSEDNE